MEQGLQSVFVIAGRERNDAIKKLWENSLSRVVVDLVRHVRRHALKCTVGDLGWFVDKLARFPDRCVHELVQWQDGSGCEACQLLADHAERQSSVKFDL